MFQPKKERKKKKKCLSTNLSSMNYYQEFVTQFIVYSVSKFQPRHT